MITVTDTVFQLDTRTTSYLVRAEGGLLQQLYYGPKIKVCDTGPLLTKNAAGYGSEVVYRPDTAPLSLDSLPLDFSPQNKGDFRLSSFIAAQKAGTTADFAYTGFEILNETPVLDGLPSPHGADGTLALYLATATGLQVTLFYTVYEQADVIARTVRVYNGTQDTVQLQRADSFQLDLPGCAYTLYTLTGAWARERNVTPHRLAPGAVCFGSRSGVSSSRTNPFFFLKEDGATEFAGRVYGFNLVYSGSFEGAAEVSTLGETRVLAGVQSDGFCWPLAPGQQFDAPWAVMTCSDGGANGMSDNMHRFVKQHILPPVFATRPRPVLLNNWEATYFDFNERRLLKLAREAAALGVELFVLDDGWFGARNSDKAGLGDYAVNTKKLPQGLAGLAQKVNALGMQFGLWMEPEMVNEDSDLYRAHPDWAVTVPGVAPSRGRNQLVLDLCRPEVRDYIVQQVVSTVQSAPIRYVKWDMNRPLTDLYSPALDEQGRFSHRYVQGLYDVLARVTAACPDVLFESCASGGNRFDLGMLCYMPQIWASDDTDAYERQKIQTGTSYGYPQCVVGAHVSASPNHQTARQSPLEARFDVAAFGLLGYELDLAVASPVEKKMMAAQISWYKVHREVLQQGRFYRLQSPFEVDGSRGTETRETRWMVVSEDRTEAVAGEFQGLVVPNSAGRPLRLAGLSPQRMYTVTVRPERIAIKTFGSLLNQILPVHVNTDGYLMHAVGDLKALDCEQESYTAWGDLLMRAGIRLKQAFTGTGYNENVRPMPDFAARLYEIKAGKAALPEEKERKDEPDV